MRFCQSHWDRLRQEISDRGLSHLVSGDGAKAVAKMQIELTEGAVTRESFDPLLSALWAITTNVMRLIDRAGNDPLYLMAVGPEDPVAYPGFEGRTWSRCPLCYLNLAHEVSCTDPRCGLDKKAGYDWVMARAADNVLATARDLGLVPVS